MLTDKGERTKQHLIKTSAALFNKRGYSGTHISDILETAGYSKGALYRIFETKDELAKEAFKYNLNILETALKQAIAKEKEPLEKLLAIPRFYSKNRVDVIIPGGCPILNTATEVDDTKPELNRLVKQAYTSWKQIIVDIAENGKEMKQIPTNVDGKVLANFLIALIEGSIAMIKVYKNQEIMKQNMIEFESYLKSVL